LGRRCDLKQTLEITRNNMFIGVTFDDFYCSPTRNENSETLANLFHTLIPSNSNDYLVAIA